VRVSGAAEAQRKSAHFQSLIHQAQADGVMKERIRKATLRRARDATLGTQIPGQNADPTAGELDTTLSQFRLILLLNS